MRANVLIRQRNVYRDLLHLHRAHPERYPYLLESTARGGANARYDILFAFPRETLMLEDARPLKGGDFLENFDAWWKQSAPHASAEHAPAPFRGGWFVFLGYELAGQIEPRLHLPAAASALPIAFATRTPAAIIRDHETRSTLLIAEAHEAGLLDLMEDDFESSFCNSEDGLTQFVDVLEEDDPEAYLQGVERIKHYIAEGDVFQVNLSRAWRARLREAAHYTEVYQHLRTHNPAPFAGLARFGDAAILSSSPERLVRVRGDRIETRPIAGTRPRGDNARKDRDYSRALMHHPKERAEHVMLIDLERNDLGRVCRPGSVEVDELMVLESYAHVHHIVSNVRGRLREAVTPGQVLRAVFPGGTITGCPKVRCMEIIAELEQTPRGPYTGSMGYINRDGSMDFNILIRTIAVQNREISLRAGAGIVADSQPLSELEETRAKARGMLLALKAYVFL